MQPIEKQITYTIQNSYSTLNKITPNTKRVWIVCHGIGYLSRYFLKYFNELPAEENYIIAPQAQAKFYLDKKYKHVGASWLTKENTKAEIKNVIHYLDAVIEEEEIPEQCELIIFGYSQGVSIVSRWLTHRKIKCNQLILYAGGLPNELTPNDFSFLNENNTKTTVIVGNKDEYLTPERLLIEQKKISTLFHGKAKYIVFDGGHEVKKEIINAL